MFSRCVQISVRMQCMRIGECVRQISFLQAIVADVFTVIPLSIVKIIIIIGECFHVYTLEMISRSFPDMRYRSWSPQFTFEHITEAKTISRQNAEFVQILKINKFRNIFMIIASGSISCARVFVCVCVCVPCVRGRPVGTRTGYDLWSLIALPHSIDRYTTLYYTERYGQRSQ